MPHKVSILVAAYNTEGYIAQCLDSLTHQTLRDIQIICIDDASTDHTPHIIERYARQDARILLLRHTTNKGQACARNYGLTRADGEFVTMVDSDDWLAPDALARAYTAATITPDTDAALFKLIYYYQSSGHYVPYPHTATGDCFTGREAFRLSMNWTLHGLYLVRREIHQRYPFDDSCRLYSDDNTTRIHFLHCRKVRLSDGQYYYRQHDKSTTRRCSIRYFDRLDAALSMKKQLRGENVDEDIMRLQETHRWCLIVEAYGYWRRHLSAFGPDENRLIRQKIRAHWADTELHLVDRKTLHKFGYIPFRRSFPLFCIEAGLYGRLQRVVHRLKGLPAR